MKKYKTPIIIGLIIGFSLIAIWTWYLATLPDMNEQLKYSPFNNYGTWECEEYDFTIYSDDTHDEEYSYSEVYGILHLENISYNFNIHYLSNRGFSHKYAVTIYFQSDHDIDDQNSCRFSCKYIFNENSFILKDFYFSTDNNFLNKKKELHFNKQQKNF